MNYKKQLNSSLNNVFSRLGITLIALISFVLVTILLAKSIGEMSWHFLN